MSLVFMDLNGNEIPVFAHADQPIELIIPRDPNIIRTPFARQNLSHIQQHNQTFNSHLVKLLRNNSLTVSVHFEIHPLNETRGYCLIYRFDDIPQINASIQLFDGWSLLCPQSNGAMFCPVRQVGASISF
jgi:hypothetical protein